MYSWLRELIGVPVEGGMSTIMNGCIQIIQGAVVAVTIMFVFVLLRMIWGRR